MQIHTKYNPVFSKCANTGSITIINMIPIQSNTDQCKLKYRPIQAPRQINAHIIFFNTNYSKYHTGICTVKTGCTTHTASTASTTFYSCVRGLALSSSEDCRETPPPPFFFPPLPLRLSASIAPPPPIPFHCYWREGAAHRPITSTLERGWRRE